MALKRVVLQLFPRQRYAGGTTAKLFFPKDRERLIKELGGASKVTVHARVYDRSATGAPSVDFDFVMGSFGEEAPANSLRSFSLAKSAENPSTPWNAANMANVPDDGTFVIVPTMGLVDTSMKVSGTAACWVEVEVWCTAEYSG